MSKDLSTSSTSEGFPAVSFMVSEVFPFPLPTTGGRHWHPNQMGLQPGPAHAALPSQILLQTAGREREQQDAVPRPQLQVSQGQRSSSPCSHAVCTFLIIIAALVIFRLRFPTASR